MDDLIAIELIVLLDPVPERLGAAYDIKIKNFAVCFPNDFLGVGKTIHLRCHLVAFDQHPLIQHPFDLVINAKAQRHRLAVIKDIAPCHIM